MASLAIVAARQIQIDIRHLAAFFGQKALKQQVHANRIHRRDSQRITDRAVGSRAASLHQNIIPPAEIDNVPDNQEVTGAV